MTGTVIVRVVVVTYSPGPQLARLLASLPAACSAPFEVVLADNGSIDGAPEAAAKQPGVELRRTVGNVGYGSAANVGAEDSGADWLLVCNPDLELMPGAVDNLLDAAQRWPRGGSLGPAIYKPDGVLYPSARSLPSLSRGIGHAVLGRTWPENPWTRAYRRESDHTSERDSGWLSGACLLVRRAAWKSVGGFDPRYFMYFEDVDLGDRMRRAGWLNIYVPSATVTHVGGTTTSAAPGAMLHAHHRSASLYVSDRYPSAVAVSVGAGLRMRSAWLRRRS